MFQTFDSVADFSQSGERVAALRQRLSALSIDGFLVPRADAHQNEYIPASEARLEWLTGFMGSAGVALVLSERAFILVDGRYTVQVRTQVDLAVFEPIAAAETDLAALLKREGRGGAIGFDPWLHTIAEARRLRTALEEVGGTLVAVEANPIDAIWNDRPAAPGRPAFVHPEFYAGRGVPEKLEEVRTSLASARLDAAVLTDPASACWLFNIRGADVAHTPLLIAFAIVPATGAPILFAPPGKLGEEVRLHLAGQVKIAPPEHFELELSALAREGQRIGLDPQLAAEKLARLIEEAGGTVVEVADPARLPRARKNEREIAGAVAAQLRDGAALTAFLCWLDQQPPGTISEIDAVEKLEEMRAEQAERDGLRLEEISFDTIAGSGPNGAIVHYRVDRVSDRLLGGGELFLLDSGGQYVDGTTDVTRTVAIGTPTAEMRRAFTLVLKGMIAISRARFPKGTRGVDLDPLARQALWRAGLDYAHGTGHGVGSFLSVHEGPASISRRGMVPIEAGMILSNEPGYYREGAFGIRIENLLCAEDPAEIEGGDIAMMGFRTLTLAPIDLALVDPQLLDGEEIAWLDAYHGEVRHLIGPRLSGDERLWLERATRPVASYVESPPSVGGGEPTPGLI